MGSSRATIFVVIVMLFGRPVLSQNCPYGWFDRPNSNKCYFFTFNSAVNTWGDSRLKCTASGGDLVSINDQQEFSYINQTIYKLFIKSQKHYVHWWIGLNRRDDQSTWKWPDGSVADLSFLQWKPHTATGDKTKNCALLTLSQLDLGSCTSSVYQSICTRPKGLPIQCDVNNGWQHYNGYCYKYFNTARTWNDASHACRTMGAVLPMIADQTTQTILSDFARQQKTNLWIGLRSTGMPNNIQWKWQDSTPLGTNPYWVPKQPPSNMNTRINTTCVELNVNGHPPSTWVVDNCGTKRKYYCQRPEGKCADGWLEFGAMCYQFNPQFKVSWPKARAYCHGQGGNLVAITKSTIQAFLQPYLRAQKSFGVSEIWIGLTDNNKDGGPWTFDNGQNIGQTHYSNWVGSPKNNHGRQDCVYIVSSDANGKWRVASSCNQIRSFICQIQTNKQVKKITQPPNHYICSDHWSINGQFCYLFNEEDKSFDNARAWCKQQYADLVRITDASVLSFLLSKAQHGDYWIGLTDRHQEGLWAWLDDTTNSTYINWNKGEPNSGYGGNENCAQMYGGSSGSSRNGKWNDARCDKSYNFICQKPAKNAFNTPLPTTPKPWSSKCGPFWSSDSFSPNCYQFSDEKLTWFDARYACHSRAGELASIETSEESAFITGRIHAKHSVDYWIAANDQGTEGGWKWVDGRPFAFLNWNAGEPNDYNHNEDCASIISSTGRWHDQFCNLRKGFICKKSAYYVCDSGWTEFKHNCYNLNHAKNTWQNARNWCKQQHSDLVKINDLVTLGFLRDHVDRSGDWWIGLNDIKTEGTFVWLDDKSPSGVIQWKQGEPNAQGNEDCVGIAMTLGSANIGKYNDWNCGNKMNFICKKSAHQTGHTSLPKTTTPKSVPAGSMYGCPNNWRGYRGSCYNFAEGSRTYDDANAQCGYSAAKLASIVDDAENKFVFSMIPKRLAQPGKSVWIGLNDRAIEMKYVWNDGQPVSYTKWYKGEPNNWQGHDEDCVAIYTKSPYWLDQVCTYKLPGAVCKKPKSIIPNSQLEIGNGCHGAQLGYHTTCYDFRWSPTKTWSDAEKDCASSKGHLATIPDRHVQAFLGAEMLYKPTAFWVGLTDRQTPGQYQWSSGQKFGFSSWYETHTGNERSTCVGIRAGHPAGLWENHNCTEHRSYICEYPRTGYTTLPTTPTTTPSPIPCPNSWTEFAGVCYKYFGGHANLQTWTEARDICQGYGGYLVSIHNSSLETFLTQNLLSKQQQKHTFWIGLNDRDVENGYQWIDQTVFDYSNWAHGEPNNYNTQEDCVEFNPISQSWNDYYCYSGKSYLCQLPKGIQITTTPPPPVAVTSSQCKGNGTWYYYNNRCFMVNPNNGTDAQKSWFDAERYCLSMGGELASIHSPDDNGFLTSLISKTMKNLQVWIGLNNLDMSGYRWTDGTAVQFLAWHIRQPDDGAGEKRCVYLRNQYGSWFDENCNDIMGFICKKRPRNVNPMTPAPTALIQGGCPAGFTTFFASNRCYMLGGTASTDSRLNWANANAQCKKLASGANLAVITTQLENKFVTTLLRGLKIQVWIGLTDRQTNGLYMWEDSTEVDYTSWAPGQPDEDITNAKIQHRRDCVMVWTQYSGKFLAGGWDDYFCDTKKPYVCSVPKVTLGYNTPTPRTTGCPQGYVRYTGSCYKGVKTRKTWNDAQSACASEGANLVSINNIFEASFVDLIMIRQGNTWIGLSNVQSKDSFTWSDKVPVRYTHWAFKEPSTGPGQGCVVEKTNFRWNNTECTHLYNYICEIHISAGPTTTPVVVGYCPDNTWTSGTDYCYKAMGSPKSWPEARYMCQRMGGDLASIGSQTEMTFISNMLANNRTDVWIGLTKTENGGFMWTDRTAVDYLNWAQNEPSDPDSKWHQDCVLMMTMSSLQWNDLDCFNQAGYICKILKSTSTYATSSNAVPVVTQNPQTQRPPTQAPPTRAPYTNRPQNTPYHPQNTPYHPQNTPYNPVNPFNTPYKPVTQRPPIIIPTFQGYTAAPLVNNPAPSGGGMSGGAIAGVIIGVIAILVLVAIGFLVVRRRYNILPNLPIGFENALYSKHSEEVSVSSKNPRSVLYTNSNEEDC